MVWVPTSSAEVVNVAVPSPATARGAPRLVPSSVNWTVPLATGVPSVVTVAVTVTLRRPSTGWGSSSATWWSRREWPP